MNSTSGQTEIGPIALSMREKLESIFAPIRLSILDESSRHAGHAGAERAVQKALSEEFQMGLHALSVKALSPEEGA